MLIVPSRQAVILKASNPAQILSCIPTAKAFSYKNQKLLYVPHRLDETKIMRNLGAAVPSPMWYYYKYPKAQNKYDPFDHQRITSEFLTYHRKAAILNEPRCVDADTEYLSSAGWVKIKEYCGGYVAQYNQTTGRAEFVLPEQYHITPCTHMVHIQTRSIDQMLSFGHRVLLRRSDGKEVVREAISIHEKLSGGKKLLPWGVPVTFAPPKTHGIRLTSEEIRVMVAVIADGYFAPNNTNRVVIRLKRQRKILRLRKLLRAAKIKFKERKDVSLTGYGFTVFSFYAPRREKDFSQWWECGAKQLQIVSDEVLHWDGNVTTGRDRFSTFIKASADFIQYVFATTGYCTSLKQNVRFRRGKIEIKYTVHRHKNKSGVLLFAGGSSSPKNNSKIVPTVDGKMYCFTVPSKFLILRRNGHVFVSGNTGKTLSCLWTADYLMQQKVIRKVLVVCPLSTIDIVWAQEIFATFWQRKVAVLYGSRERRLAILSQPADFYLVNHDGFQIVAEHLPADIDLVIYDEAAVMRNPSTRRFRAFHKYMDLRPQMRLWLLTGTPTPNEPTDAWALCKLLGVANLPRYTLFREQVMMKVAQWQWRPRPGSEQMVSQMLQPSIRYTRDECFDLPDTTYETRQCELSAAQKKAFKHMIQQFAVDIKGQQITAVNEASKIQKLLQILLGVVYTDSGEEVYIDCESRIAVVKEVIEECSEKVIVFVPFTGALHGLAEALGRHFTVATVNGQVTKNQRTEIFRAFMETDNPRVLVADARTMSHGLDLSRATTTIWAGPTNSNDTYGQACARIQGPRQTHKTSIVHIEATEVEKKIFKRLKEKQSMAGLLLDIIQNQEETL